MKESQFQKLRENCPWYYVGTNLRHSKSCWAVQENKKLDVTCDKEFGIECCKKNCAIYYWIVAKTKDDAAKEAILRKEILKTRCPG